MCGDSTRGSMLFATSVDRSEERGAVELLSLLCTAVLMGFFIYL